LRNPLSNKSYVDMAQNYLLASLPPELYEKLAPSMQEVSLPHGKILHSPGEVIEDIYFPLDCLLSMIVTTKDGATAEAGAIGNREVLGLNAFMGGRETTNTQFIVQVPGKAIKADAKIWREEFDRSPALRNVLLRCTQALIAQIVQTAACNRLHVLEQRLARWLLEAQDRTKSDDLQLTQEFIADMLGVRRAGVTQAAQKLQDRGLICYSRGRVQILHQQGLEAAACECFQVVKDEYDRLLGRPGDCQ